MSFSNYLETELLDHVFANNAYTSPSSVYVGLFTTSPAEDGSGTEVSGGSYARQSAFLLYSCPIRVVYTDEMSMKNQILVAKHHPRWLLCGLVSNFEV